MEELKIGDIIKQRYTLMQFLGSGSFGEVWLAHDQMTGRDVALKIYLSLDPAGVEEFQREYSNTADLSSPYLLTPEYFDVHNRRPFLVMKYCGNGSSSKLTGQISEDKLWSFIHDVASGLEVLHSQSDPIVHQDIKPDNILIDSNGRFLITDFGISKRLRATMRRQSKRDVCSGAMPYMAPERFDANPRLSTASDIWSLGASIYELATGELPFSGFGGAMQRSGAEIPYLPDSYSKKINDIMQKCLMHNETDRPSVTELLKVCLSKDEKQICNNNLPQIVRPTKPIQFDIEGNITETIVKPNFNNAFGWIWFFVVLFISSSMFGFLHDLHSHLYLNGDAPSYSQVIRCIALLCPSIMWIFGYLLVKEWKSVGKYLMCGSIYLISLSWIYGICGMLTNIIPQSNFSKQHWYDYFEPIIGLLMTGAFIIASLYGLYIGLRTIKMGRKTSPIIWHYNGHKLIPIMMEVIFPIIVVVVYIISWKI